ncbi:GNAT family N-acetyltransferase [Marinilactibacillus kalidii]|uniref:GNAT family N-acetyltransferase n=1 Tax=Marinilactibacillus kalidii TaxID=2820274 RepID=UPI001ABEAD0D|nr:GNAT family N-acetyltransferase [Marinilactibacillus kalidii]
MIREAKVEDSEAIVELFKVILLDMALPIMKQVSWDKLKVALIEATKQEAYRHSFKHAIVSDIDGEIAGFCFGYPGEMSEANDRELQPILEKHALPLFQTFYPQETMAGEWYLDSLVVHESFRGQGIGRQLLQAAYQSAKLSGQTKIGLNVDHENPRAKKLYEQQGFTKMKELTIAGHRYDHMQKNL